MRVLDSTLNSPSDHWGRCDSSYLETKKIRLMAFDRILVGFSLN